jgi:hypothetical protein
MYWPMPFLADDATRDAYRQLVVGAAVLQGVGYSLGIAAIYLPPALLLPPLRSSARCPRPPLAPRRQTVSWIHSDSCVFKMFGKAPDGKAAPRWASSTVPWTWPSVPRATQSNGVFKIVGVVRSKRFTSARVLRRLCVRQIRGAARCGVRADVQGARFGID